MNRAIKTILLLASHQNKTFTDHIHAGNLSCVRDGARKVRDQQTVFAESFRLCAHFALAFDTALFGQEHVLSCIVRFTFEDRVMQMPMFSARVILQRGKNLPISSSASWMVLTSRSRNCLVFQQMAQQVWLEWQMEWLLIWRGWSPVNMGSNTVKWSRCGVLHTVWTWLSSISNTPISSIQFSASVIGSQQN